jgi:hypothetical protein
MSKLLSEASPFWLARTPKFPSTIWPPLFSPFIKKVFLFACVVQLKHLWQSPRTFLQSSLYAASSSQLLCTTNYYHFIISELYSLLLTVFFWLSVRLMPCVRKVFQWKDKAIMGYCGTLFVSLVSPKGYSSSFVFFTSQEQLCHIYYSILSILLVSKKSLYKMYCYALIYFYIASQMMCIKHKSMMSVLCLKLWLSPHWLCNKI